MFSKRERARDIICKVQTYIKLYLAPEMLRRVRSILAAVHCNDRASLSSVSISQAEVRLDEILPIYSSILFWVLLFVSPCIMHIHAPIYQYILCSPGQCIIIYKVTETTSVCEKSRCRCRVVCKWRKVTASSRRPSNHSQSHYRTQLSLWDGSPKSVRAHSFSV